MSIFRIDFYSKDWLLKTQRLSLEERGALVTINMAYHVYGELENNHRYIARLCNCTPNKIKKILSSLAEKDFIEFDGAGLSPVKPHFLIPSTSRKPIPLRIRDFVMNRDGLVCTYCGDKGGPFHLDHIHPVALGGGNEPENLTVSCAPCNYSKGSKTLEQWAGLQ